MKYSNRTFISIINILIKHSTVAYSGHNRKTLSIAVA